MLKYYVRHSASEEFQRVQTAPKENVWVQAEDVTTHELTFLSQAYHMDFNILRDVLDQDELPHVEIHNGIIYVFVRTVARSKHGKITTTPMLLTANGAVFASISGAEVNDTKPSAATLAHAGFDPVGLMLDTFATVISDYETLMKRTARHIHDTGRRLRTHEVTNDDFIRFVTVEDNLNEYRMNLNAMLVVAQRLQETLREGVDSEAIGDILQYIRQLIVAIDSYNQSIISIRNAYSTIANNVLNQRMKTLTVLTLLVALPNVFYGMYGMNVMLPFADQPWAYGMVVAFTVVVIIVVFVIAKKKGIF